MTMKKLKAVILFSVFFGALFFVEADLYAGEREILETFKNITMVKLETFSGDCVVKKGTGSEVKVRYVYGDFGTGDKPKFKQEGSTLVLKEKLHLSGSGDSTWYLTVPGKTAIKFKSLSGNFSVEGLKSKISVETVSGDVEAGNCSGDIYLSSISGDFEVENLSGNVRVKSVSSDLEVKKLSGEVHVKSVSGEIEAEELEGAIVLKVASGDIDINDSRGHFDVKTASGDISASNIIIKGESRFKVASGDVDVKLGKSSAHDLTLASASGDAVLNYNGNPIEGYFEFKALDDGGKIFSPFAFDREEEEEKWGKKYLIKSFKRKSGTPKILIYTASGKAVLKEK